MSFTNYRNFKKIFFLLILISSNNLICQQSQKYLATVVDSFKNLFNLKSSQILNDLRSSDNLINITYPLSPYVVNNKTVTTVTGKAKENIKKVKVTLLHEKNNKLNEIVEKYVDVIDNNWSCDLPNNLQDGNYLIQASYDELNVYSGFKINCCIPTLKIKSPYNLEKVQTNKPVISGFASIGSKVVLEINNKVVAELVPSYSGHWSYKFDRKLRDGLYVLVAKAFNSTCDNVSVDNAAFETIIFQVGENNCLF